MILSSSWAQGWNASNLVALYSVANASANGTSRLIAALCGPIEEAAPCGDGAAGSDLVNGTLDSTSIASGSPLGIGALAKL